MRWLIDGSNVMGSRPDGWWRDRRAAAARLADEVEAWCTAEAPGPVLVVFDGSPDGAAPPDRPDGFEVRFAPGRRDAADDAIVDELGHLLRSEAPEAVCVVTADRGLLARLPDGVRSEGPKTFLARLG